MNTILRTVPVRVRYFRGTRAVRQQGIAGTVPKEWLKAYLQGPQAGAAVVSGLAARQRRILFRSRQRGWLELDVLLGSWAAKHVPAMTAEGQLADMENLLTVETPHLYQWIVGQSEVPPQFASSESLRSMQKFARGTGMVRERL